MLDGNNDRPTVTESYAGAVGGSNLRVGNDHTVRTQGDLIAAAGMNRHRMGTALMRLMSEWQSGATPPPAEPVSLKELRRQNPSMNAETVEAERRRRAAECTRWNQQENMLRFQRLKTLGTVRAGLLFWVQERGWDEGGEHLVASVLQRFLSPICSVCGGRGSHIVKDTARKGRECKACSGTGEVKLKSGRAQRLMDYLQVCTGQAAKDLREGSQRLHRGSGNVEDRAGIRAREEVERLQRADREAEADAKQDTAAVAARFRDSMGRRR